jgi:hypothetical protein
VTHTKEARNAYRFLLGKPGGERPLGRPRCRREYNIKMYLKIGLEGMN